MIISTKHYYLELNFSAFLRRVIWKSYAACCRIVDIFRLFPTRFIRFLMHPIVGVRYLLLGLLDSRERQNLPGMVLGWWMEWPLMLLEVFGVAEWFEIVHEFVKFNARPLHQWEKEMAYSVFGDSLNYARIRIDEYSIAGPRQKQFCYVSFFVVNSWGPMTNSVLLHELVHVWQFQNMGIVYIPRALRAQYSSKGYNYGGLDALQMQIEQGKGLDSFNLEQQADIIADYFRIKNGYRPRWGSANLLDLPTYQHFVDHLNKRLNRKLAW